MRRHLEAEVVSREPYLVWNAFVDLLALESYEDLSESQRVAHLAFWYDSEIQNGGHHQFFINRSGSRSTETVSALRSLKLDAHADVLESAISAWRQRDRSAPRDANEFLAGALEGELEAFDSAYHECQPTIMDALQNLLSERQADFVVVGHGS